MSQNAWFIVYAAVFAEALIVSMLLMPVGMALARRFGYVCHPSGGRHNHRAPTPTLGGVAIVWSFLGVILVNLVVGYFSRGLLIGRIPGVGAYLANIPSRLVPLLAVMGGGLAMHVIGLIDDKRPLPPRLKLLLMIAVAAVLPFSGVRIQGFVPSFPVQAMATIVWVVFLTNSFNFLDNTDGLCAGIAAVIVLAFALLGATAGEYYMTAVFAVFAGSILGFLRFNFPPARSFMGDNGSLFIGYVTGALSILATYIEKDARTALPVLTPLVVLGVPIFDTVSVMWIRLREHRPLMVGDRCHFSHRLLDLGMPTRRAVTFVYILTAAVALGAVPLRSASAVGGLAVFAQVALIFWAIYRLERTAKKRLE
jgi:UDP-GlcNAc:undecaprenyl-phosphate GlcNAc-1-phosphate transferase